MKLLTGGQFRELDRYTIEHEPISSIDLMERASHAVTDEVLRRYGTAQKRFFIFSGPGGNGGDGLAVARMLSEAGQMVHAYLFNVSGKLSEDCQTNRDRLKTAEEGCLTEVTTEFLFPDLHPDDIVIDALFGTGLSKSLNGGFAIVARKLNQSGCTIISIDMPSGLMCEDNTFNDPSSIVRASLTLCIGQPKLAFLFPENEKYVGEIHRLDIGLSEEGLASLKTNLWVTEPEEVASMLRLRPRFAHKGLMGHALLVSGSRGMAGAAILTAQACLRSGAGKVTVHTPLVNLPILQASIPEAIVQMDLDSDIITAAIDASSFKTIGIGPGLGCDVHTANALHDYLRQNIGPMVIDADAINLLGENPAWFNDLPTDSILTPHPKELEKLVGHCSGSYERMNRARTFALTHRVFVVVKGHYSMVCTPTGSVHFNPSGNPGMATPGSGDVLTGILTSLLAQGYLPAEAAQLGVYLHGLAGDFAAQELGEESLIASDIISHLPQAFKDLRQPSHSEESH